MKIIFYLQIRSRDRPFQRNPDLLEEINTFLSSVDLSCDCDVAANLLSILPRSPHDGCRNWFKINEKRGMLLSDAEKSMLLRWATHGV